MKISKKNLINSPDFRKLVKTQDRVGFAFTLLILISYFSFILIVGFIPELFAISISGPLNLGIIFGISLIIFSILLTIIYVIISNFTLDKIRKKINKYYAK